MRQGKDLGSWWRQERRDFLHPRCTTTLLFSRLLNFHFSAWIMDSLTGPGLRSFISPPRLLISFEPKPSQGSLSSLIRLMMGACGFRRKLSSLPYMYYEPIIIPLLSSLNREKVLRTAELLRIGFKCWNKHVWSESGFWIWRRHVVVVPRKLW